MNFTCAKVEPDAVPIADNSIRVVRGRRRGSGVGHLGKVDTMKTYTYQKPPPPAPYTPPTDNEVIAAWAFAGMAVAVMIAACFWRPRMPG